MFASRIVKKAFFRCRLPAALGIALLAARAGAASERAASPAPAVPPAAKAAIAARLIAVDNVCAWPNLTPMPDGAIVATIFNQPSHGRAEGDAECWATTDGRTWTKRGLVTQHDPSANRMNLAAGLAANGDLIAIVSGWSLKKDAEGRVLSLVEVLQPWICRSADGGRSWTADKQSFPKQPEGFTPLIPFGDVLVGNDGALRAACYARNLQTRLDSLWIVRSADDGRTWTFQARISEANNETALFHAGGGQWLAAARSLGKTKQRLDLWRSADDGQTWTDGGPLSEASQHPAHIVRLRDGRLLLTYGNRVKGQFGVLVRQSPDNGATWGDPITLVDDLANTDCGYPASASLPGNEVLTVYYSRGAPEHDRYHMGAVIWNPTSTCKP